MAETGESYYRRGPAPSGVSPEEAGAGEWFHPSAHVESTWSPSMQHGAPPSALVVHALERCAPRADARISQVSFDFLGPIATAPLQVRAWVERPGRQVELLVAELWAAPVPGRGPGLQRVARAQAWRVQTAALPTSVVGSPLPPLTPLPDQLPVVVPGAPEGAVSSGVLSEEEAAFWSCGYIRSTEFRVIRPFGGPPPVQVWMRARHPLLPDEATSPLVGLFLVADSANGIGASLDVREYTFLNTELSVHLFRAPVGEWVGFSAATSVGPDGIGTSAADLHDVEGPVGRIAQNLLIRPRTG